MPPVRRRLATVVSALASVGLLAGSALAQGYVYPAKGQSPTEDDKRGKPTNRLSDVGA